MASEAASLIPRTPKNSSSLPGVADDHENEDERRQLEKIMRRKVDLRLCTIAGLLCSLNLLDSGIISSASVTSMLKDL